MNSISKDKEIQVNHDIRDREVRVIAPDGKQLGVMSTKDALRYAQEAQLDLVKIAPDAKPPVCKIMDFGKYKYEQSKRDKEARKKQKIINIKEISIKFRGRQMTHTKLGEEVLNKFVEGVKDYGFAEKEPKMEGRNMVVVISPKETTEKE